MKAQEIARKLGLQRHIEGGYFRETYRSATQTSVNYSEEPRNVCTGIYFLLEPGQVSRLHRIHSDEMWHFYRGDTLTVIVLDSQAPNHYRSIRLGNRLELGEEPQFVVPAGAWFGAYLDDASVSQEFGYSLVGCTVAPGFDMRDFELADRETLIREFPRAATIIDKMTVIP